MARRTGARRFKLLGLGVLMCVVLWSVAWFVAATVIDRQVDRAEIMAMKAGATATCVNRSVTGFPFRIEVRCGDGSRAGSADGIVTVGGLSVVAQVYNPSEIIAEVSGPVGIDNGRVAPIIADWDLAHASVRLDLAGRALSQLTAEIKVATVSFGPALVSVGEVDGSIRADPARPGDIDYFVRLADAVPLQGAQPATVSLTGRLEGAASLLGGRSQAVLEKLLASGIRTTIEALTFQCGEMMVAAAGELTLAPDGLLDGTIDVALTGYEAGLPYVNVVAPEREVTLTQILTNLLAYAPDAQVGGRTGKKLRLTVSDGRVSVGFVPLFRIPRIGPAQ